MDILYRKANVGDIPIILDILSSVAGNIEDINSTQFLIAEDNSKIIGCVRIKNYDCCLKLLSLAVIPNHRMMGIGKTLVLKILDDNTKRPVYLFCNIKYKNFYKKFGFKKVEVKSIPEILQKDYKSLLNMKFANDEKILITMELS